MFKLPDRLHRPNVYQNARTGNAFFCSKNLLFGYTFSRRDDIISIAYSIIFLINNYAPFLREALQKNPGIDHEGINLEFLAFKKQASAKAFCEKMHTLFMRDFLQEAYLIAYDQTPNYSKLRFLLIRELLNLSHSPKTRYSWS